MKRKKTLIALMTAIALSVSPLMLQADEWSDSIDDIYPGYVDLTDEIFRVDEELPLLRAQSDIPDFYDAREHGQVTSVKNQNPWGTCWSFVALTALESSMLSRGLVEEIDLSEYHLINYNLLKIRDSQIIFFLVC